MVDTNGGKACDSKKAITFPAKIRKNQTEGMIGLAF
jgi:hypothetical protein